MKKLAYVFIAILLGVFIGSIIEPKGAIYQGLDVGGTLFIQALTLIVTPLVVSSIITGVKRVSDETEFGKLGLTILVTFVMINLIGVLIGLCVGNLTSPGVGFIWKGAAQIAPRPTENGLLASFLLEIVPPNILDAFAKGKLLGLIFFSILFGFAIAHTSQKARQMHALFWEGIFKAMFKITQGVMFFLPLGVFCLISKVFADVGLQVLKPMMNLVGGVIFGLGFLALVIMPLILKGVAKVSVRSYFRAIAPAFVTAFSTGSSTATLPVILDCLEKRAGISNKVTSLVVPLGVTLNLAGTALYIALGALFVAQVFGIPMPLSTQLYLMFVSVIISLGIASVPGGGMVAAMALFNVMGLPLEGLAIMLTLDRILDMLRTTCNLVCYSTSTVVVARKMGENPLPSKIS